MLVVALALGALVFAYRAQGEASRLRQTAEEARIEANMAVIKSTDNRILNCYLIHLHNMTHPLCSGYDYVPKKK